MHFDIQKVYWAVSLCFLKLDNFSGPPLLFLLSLARIPFWRIGHWRSRHNCWIWAFICLRSTVALDVCLAQLACPCLLRLLLQPEHYVKIRRSRPVGRLPMERVCPWSYSTFRRDWGTRSLWLLSIIDVPLRVRGLMQPVCGDEAALT